jgi:Flp pilus assembly pilin Flp
MSYFLDLARRFLRRQRAATLVEYGLLIALIAIACIAVIVALGNAVQPLFHVPGL